MDYGICGACEFVAQISLDFDAFCDASDDGADCDGGVCELLTHASDDDGADLPCVRDGGVYADSFSRALQPSTFANPPAWHACDGDAD
jgi:hypothetical protein